MEVKTPYDAKTWAFGKDNLGSSKNWQTQWEYLGHVLLTIMSMLRDIWSPIALTYYDNYKDKASPCHCMGLWQRVGETEVYSFLQRHTNTLKMIPTTLSWHPTPELYNMFKAFLHKNHTFLEQNIFTTLPILFYFEWSWVIIGNIFRHQELDDYVCH